MAQNNAHIWPSTSVDPQLWIENMKILFELFKGQLYYVFSYTYIHFTAFLWHIKIASITALVLWDYY